MTDVNKRDITSDVSNQNMLGVSGFGAMGKKSGANPPATFPGWDIQAPHLMNTVKKAYWLALAGTVVVLTLFIVFLCSPWAWLTTRRFFDQQNRSSMKAAFDANWVFTVFSVLLSLALVLTLFLGYKKQKAATGPSVSPWLSASVWLCVSLVVCYASQAIIWMTLVGRNLVGKWVIGVMHNNAWVQLGFDFIALAFYTYLAFVTMQTRKGFSSVDLLGEYYGP